MKHIEYRVDVYEYFHIGEGHAYYKTAWFDNKEEAREYMSLYNNNDSYRVDVYNANDGAAGSHNATSLFNNKERASAFMNHYNNDDYFADLSIDVKQENVKE